MNNRRVAAIVLAGALVVPGVIGALQLSGWSAGSTAAGASGEAADAQALRDLVSTIEDGRDQTFTAQYTTLKGAVVTYAQEPARLAYRSAGGMYVSGPEATYSCRTPAGERPSCTRSEGQDSVPLGDARVMASALAADFIAPDLVTAYISRLATHVPGKVSRFDRPIVGQPAHCIAVPNAFTACVTDTGILAHFEAPDGSLTLTGFQPTVGADAFAPPRNAVVKDVSTEG